MRLVGSIRVSTIGQAQDGYGLDVQEKDIRAWCRANGHDLVKMVKDEAVKGTTEALDRPGLAEALAMIQDKKVDGLIVAKLDRLARSLTVQEAALAMVWRAGGLVFSADSGELAPDDASDPMRTAMRQMIGVFAQLERAMIVSRMAKGREAKAAAGLYAGGAPALGYR